MDELLKEYLENDRVKAKIEIIEFHQYTDTHWTVDYKKESEDFKDKEIVTTNDLLIYINNKINHGHKRL